MKETRLAKLCLTQGYIDIAESTLEAVRGALSSSPDVCDLILITQVESALERVRWANLRMQSLLAGDELR